MITLWEALKKGKELKNVESWKHFQQTVSIVGVVVAGLLYILPWLGVDIIIPDGVVDKIAEVIAGVLFILHWYLTNATTKKIGIGGKTVPVVSGRIDGM